MLLDINVKREILTGMDYIVFLIIVCFIVTGLILSGYVFYIIINSFYRILGI